MYIRDIMVTDVVTIASSASVAEARKIMDEHGLSRLPVVDKGKLVGVVSKRRLEQVSPSKATSLTMWELSYLLSKTTVKEIMAEDVVTVTPDTTVEEAVALAQNRKIGGMIVVDKDKIIGISTTTDLFYKLVNPILGLGEPGTRIEVFGGGEGKALEEIVSLINRLNIAIVTLYTHAPVHTAHRKLVVHLASEDVSGLLKELTDRGYEVNVRRRYKD